MGRMRPAFGPTMPIISRDDPLAAQSPPSVHLSRSDCREFAG